MATVVVEPQTPPRTGAETLPVAPGAPKKDSKRPRDVKHEDESTICTCPACTAAFELLEESEEQMNAANTLLRGELMYEVEKEMKTYDLGMIIGDIACEAKSNVRKARAVLNLHSSVKQ